MLVGSFEFKKSQLIQTHGENMLPKTKRLESLNVQRAVKKKLSESSHVRIVKELEK